jgi:hypothetical protein
VKDDKLGLDVIGSVAGGVVAVLLLLLLRLLTPDKP